ncbi:MAG: DUF2695 domain-containing protein [Deltaproteobacteria bacterium]|nr:DUF2695 domain-containing protein [Deltaproteobacteria bacterium]
MDLGKIREDILTFVRSSYPDMQVRVEPWSEDPSKIALFFIEKKFEPIYPLQRYHYLCHKIPKDYQDRELANTIWFELAPGESPEDLRYPDEELIEEITPDVMKCVIAAQILEALDDVMCPVDGDTPREKCHGDYRHTRPILLERRFTEDEFFDVFHVLMAQGGNCDCEILFNIAKGSRLATEYWSARAEGRKPVDSHRSG